MSKFFEHIRNRIIAVVVIVTATIVATAAFVLSKVSKQHKSEEQSVKQPIIKFVRLGKHRKAS